MVEPARVASKISLILAVFLKRTMGMAMTVHANEAPHAQAVDVSRVVVFCSDDQRRLVEHPVRGVRDGEPPRRLLDGKIDRIGLSGTNLTVNDPAGAIAGSSHASSPPTTARRSRFLLDWLEAQPVFASVKAVGHRVVHGMKHSEPERVTPKLLAELHRITPYDPDHLPREIELIEAFRQRHPRLPQVACFDTAFHRTMPRVAKSTADSATLRGQGRSSATASTVCPTPILMEELGRSSIPRPRRAA